MSDLLESVRALNPVPACEPPAITEVWRKLERQEAAAADLIPGGPGEGGSNGVPVKRIGLRPRRLRRPAVVRRGLLASFAVAVAVAVAFLVIGGGGLGATTPHGAESSAAVRRLAQGTISCPFASADSGDAPGMVGVPTRGRSAIAYCRARYGAGRDAPGARFVVCQTSATNVAVYLADGLPGRCHRLGARAVPAGYAAAVRQTRTRTVSPAPPAGVSTV